MARPSGRAHREVCHRSGLPEDLSNTRAEREEHLGHTLNPLDHFHPPVREWFTRTFKTPTRPQSLGWPSIARGESTLILAPTGTGKTLAAFLACIDRVLFSRSPAKKRACRILYVSPLKALAVDVERNLRAPIAGITRLARTMGIEVHTPNLFIRTGDTSPEERSRFLRNPADILITTPESLYLMLTSNAREAMRTVQTVIIDEIHALVPNKRGAHLAHSLERLQAICDRPLQRIGLSATQTPLQEVALFLGGMKASEKKTHGARRVKGSILSSTLVPEPVTIIDANEKKPLELRVEVPVEDLAEAHGPLSSPGDAMTAAAVTHSIWPSIHPPLLELIRSHRSTLIFVNNRRLAERLAVALNELAGGMIVRAHHGSIAREQRSEIEERLKAGELPALVATSSLELGIDMGAIDLVIQIEAPPSVASGLQRIGRASHHVGAVSRGVIYPKYRADLVACAAATRCMLDGKVEPTRFPRNPLDVLAQQIVAMCAMETWRVDDLHQTVRRAAPFAGLSREILEDVLDMLSGRYPSSEFVDLRPRITWDRGEGTLRARAGAKQVAIANGGTIPDRGLYGVFLLGAAQSNHGGDPVRARPSRSPRPRAASSMRPQITSTRGAGQARVGELDEEMVHESRVGETFLLGASTWRIEEITHDRVLVTPAPGEPGKMPFWHGDRVGRPLEFGRSVGALIRKLRSFPADQAVQCLQEQHALGSLAAQNLMTYLHEQVEDGALPDDRTIVIERCLDELGDWRVCIMTPFGGKILAPWALAIVATVRDRIGIGVETMWSDDGLVIRFPELEHPPEPQWLLPRSEEVEGLVTRELGSSALFAARFREIASRALLLPRRRPGSRAPLWQQRKRASDLLQVAARFRSFPMILETYRECLRDVFDMPALVETMQQIQGGELRVVVIDTQKPSPFAASLMFNYVANFIYDGDAPLAERRAQALMVDPARLRAIMGEAELRELLDPVSLNELESQLQCLNEARKARHLDGLHDLLLRLGDLSISEIQLRTSDPQAALDWIEQLEKSRRVFPVEINSNHRLIAVEDCARYRDGLHVPLPKGIPDSLLRPVVAAMEGLFRRYARTHGPFRVQEVAARFGVPIDRARGVLQQLELGGAIVEGEFLPGGHGPEWCDAEVLRTLRRKSLARLRREVEPVEPSVLGRFFVHWQGIQRKRIGSEELLDVIEQLQGVPIPASALEADILPARVHDYEPGDLDLLCATGEVIWVGISPLGERDGRIALFVADQAASLRFISESKLDGSDIPPSNFNERHGKIREFLRARGASFFPAIHQAAGGGYPADTLGALWDLVWSGEITNDTLAPLRNLLHPSEERRRRHSGQGIRSRPSVPPSGVGRWTLLADVFGPEISITDSAVARAQLLLDRYGILTREALVTEAVPGGSSSLHAVLKAMEEGGRVRRGYFVEGLGAMQFALPGALDELRQLRQLPNEDEMVILAATDPANAYGGALRWPVLPGGELPDARTGGKTDEETRRHGDAGKGREAGGRTDQLQVSEPPGAELADARSMSGETDSASSLRPCVPVSGVPPGRGPTRSVGCYVILINGALTAFIGRGESQFFVFLPEEEPQRSRIAKGIAEALVLWVQSGRRKRLFISTVNGIPATQSELVQALLAAGFVAGPRGFMLRRSLPSSLPQRSA